jgi:tetratricopeptide (TPR) repeat protein
VEQVVDKYRLYESVKLLLDCGDREKIIIIDNIQWIDPDSIEVLKYIFRSLKQKSLKCILVHRTEEETPGLQELTAFITREFDAREIALINFPKREIKECVKAICGEDPSDELLHFISEESGGNPFYIEQIMRELVDQNYLNLVEDKWCFKKPVSELVPKSVADIAMMKYQRLSEEGKKVLEMASLLGKFDPDLIQRMTDYNTGHIIGLIGDIENLGLVKEVGANMEFQDALSRNAIYEHCVTGIKRRSLHQEVARVLEERFKDNENEVLEELAFHYYRGKNREKGIPYCLKVGDRAKELYSNHNAIKYYKWAEELLENARDPESKRQLVECQLRQVKVLGLVGDLHDAMAILRDTKGIAQEIQDVSLQAEIQYLIAHVDYQFGDYEQGIADGEESIRLYRSIDDDLGVAKVFLTVGGSRRRMGDYARALKNFEEAQKIAQQHDDKVIELRAHGNIGNVYINMGEYSSAFARYEQAVKIAESLQDQAMIAQLLTNMGNIYYKQGIYEEAKWLYLKSLDMNRVIGNKTSEANTMNNLGSVYHSLGHYEQALQTFREALHISQATGSKQNESILLNNIGTMHRCMGEYTCAKKYYEDSMHMSEQIKSTERIFSNLVCLGELYLEQGETAKAKLMIERASEIGQASRDMLVDVYMLTCKYQLLTGELKQFTESLALLEDIQREIESESLKAEIDVLYGRCYTQTGSYDKAAEHLQKALEMYKKLKHTLSTGKVYYYLGIMEKDAGKIDFAKKDFERANELFKSVGAKQWGSWTTRQLNDLTG